MKILLFTSILLVALLQPSKTEKEPTYIKEEYVQYAVEIADMYDLEPRLIIAMIEAESSGRRKVISKAGCIGLMQVSPENHAERMEHLGVTDLTDAYGNILVGCDFIAELIDKYGDVGVALVAYNTGEYSERTKKAEESKDYNAYAKKILARILTLEHVEKVGKNEAP